MKVWIQNRGLTQWRETERVDAGQAAETEFLGNAKICERVLGLHWLPIRHINVTSCPCRASALHIAITWSLWAFSEGNDYSRYKRYPYLRSNLPENRTRNTQTY